MRQINPGRLRHESRKTTSRPRLAEPQKPKGLKTGTFITVLLVIGAILYFVSG